MTATDPAYAESEPNGTEDRSHHSRMREEGESVVEAVIRAVSEAKGVEPTTVEPLNTAVDADALNALFGPRLNGEARTGGGVFFQLDDCDVTVHGDGEVVVRRDPRPPSGR